VKRAIKNLILDAVVAQLAAGTYPKPLAVCKRGNPNAVQAKGRPQPAIYVYGAVRTSDVVANPLQFNEMEIVVVCLAMATEDTQEDVGNEYEASIEEALADDNALIIDLGDGVKIGADVQLLGGRVIAGGEQPAQACVTAIYKVAYSTGLGTPRGMR